MRTLSSTEVYRNRWMTVREDEVERADGSRGLYGVVDKPVGHLYTASGYCSQGFDVFLATGLSRRPPAREPTELDMRDRFIGEEELAEWIACGRIVDSASLAAYSLFLLRRG